MGLAVGHRAGRLCVTVRGAVSKAGGDANAWSSTTLHVQARMVPPRRRRSGALRYGSEPRWTIRRSGHSELFEAPTKMPAAQWPWLYGGHGVRQLDRASVLTPDAHSRRNRRRAAETCCVFSSSMPCASRWALSSCSGSQRLLKSLLGRPSVRCQASHRLEWRLFSRAHRRVSASLSRAEHSVCASTSFSRPCGS